MSPFPQAIANAQRRALADELREARANVNAIRASLRSLQGPHLVAMDHVDYSLVTTHLNDAEAAIFAALEVATADEL